ncbi:MAG: type II secretion system F family protein [bacterium]|nr:type II secretion system F family protein [bacterium]
MPTYQYRARNKEGEIVTGRLDTDSEPQVIAQLEALGNLPITVSLVKKKEGPKFKFSLGGKIKGKTLVVFTRQLATMIRAGVPIIASLNTLIAESENEKFKEILREINMAIQEGSPFSRALSLHPKVFTKLYISTVLSGEAGGTLDVSLNRLAALLEHESEIQANIKAATRYPIIVIVGITIAFFVLVTTVVPKFASVFAASKVALPLPTRILIGIDYGIRHYWFYIVPSILFLAFGLWKYIQTERGRYQWDWIKLKLPIFGPLSTKTAASRFAQTLATLNRSGLPILKTLDIVGTTVGNVVIAEEINKLSASVTEGKGLAEPLLEGKFFPPLVSHMVAIGERSGHLDEMLDSLQQHYDQEINSMVKNLTTLIEPILTVALGVIVLFIAMGIFLPMWNLASAVK